jgi:cysteine-rich repeat protein
MRLGCVIAFALALVACDPVSEYEPDAAVDATVTPPVPICGNGVIEAGEECDNGAANSDAVADACRRDCTKARCGDRVIDTGEQCDDGNTTAGDGCSATCQIESCSGTPPANYGQSCTDPSCGTGTILCSGVCSTQAPADLGQSCAGHCPVGSTLIDARIDCGGKCISSCDRQTCNPPTHCM